MTSRLSKDIDEWNRDDWLAQEEEWLGKFNIRKNQLRELTKLQEQTRHVHNLFRQLLVNVTGTDSIATPAIIQAVGLLYCLETKQGLEKKDGHWRLEMCLSWDYQCVLVIDCLPETEISVQLKQLKKQYMDSSCIRDMVEDDINGMTVEFERNADETCEITVYRTPDRTTKTLDKWNDSDWELQQRYWKAQFQIFDRETEELQRQTKEVHNMFRPYIHEFQHKVEIIDTEGNDKVTAASIHAVELLYCIQKGLTRKIFIDNGFESVFLYLTGQYDEDLRNLVNEFTTNRHHNEEDINGHTVKIDPVNAGCEIRVGSPELHDDTDDSSEDSNACNPDMFPVYSDDSDTDPQFWHSLLQITHALARTISVD